jgi:phosphate transport system permease protein
VAIDVGRFRAGEPGSPAPPLVVSRARTSRRILLDRLAARTVVLGGLLIIASILAILLVIVAEIWPLFRAARASLEPVSNVAAVPVGPEAAGVDEYREIAYTVSAEGMLQLTPLRAAAGPAHGAQPGGAPHGGVQRVAVEGLDGARLTAAAELGRGRHLLGTSDGRVIPIEVTYEPEFKDGRRTITPRQVFKPAAVVDAEARPIQRLAAAAPEGGPVVVAQVGATDLVLQSVVERTALIGGSRREESITALRGAADEPITAMVIDARGEDLFVGTTAGRVVRYDLRDRGAATRAEVAEIGGGRAITALRFLNGDRTLIAGTEGGEVVSGQVIPGPDGAPRLTPIHRFARHAAPVAAIAVSQRDKGFVTVDRDGGAHVSYGTTGARLLELKAPAGDVRAVVFAPKADGILSIDGRGGVAHWRLDNPHPEVTLATLFGQVWYEGYRAPAWVWQSTGGTDDFEAKLSLTPLVYGTLKGTFYALVIAVPLALLAALYVSEFMHPALKTWVKPMVEIMAALPSVVLGFLAGLWLAPVVERIVPGLFVMPLVMTIAILVAMAAWQLLPARARNRVRPGAEMFLLVPVVVVAAAIAFAIGGLIEASLLAGDYRGWLLSALGLTYDQRNSLVVGVAMGFAVIPIIFTIAEDSLANVPQHLRAGSLAMGATRWQTAVRIVLPTASPGIFSAVMIGFGRAVGETMIVLMATGNTPVMDWNVFSGFRALSANIAVELPEAPEGGTLFRVLFLAAFLLFCLTFAVNTAAEVVRLKLRQRYRYL